MTGGARVDLDLSPLDKLRAGLVAKAVRIGVSRAASPVKAAVVAGAERLRRYGFLAKAQRIRIRRYPGDKVVAVVGASRAFQRQKGKFSRGRRAGQPRRQVPAMYAHLVERGTSRSRARPFLRPALDQTGPAFLRDVPVFVGREIAAALPAG